MKRVPATLCARCKGGKLLCGLSACPLLERFRAEVRAFTRMPSTTRVYGATPPSLVVGERGYPRVAVMYNVPPGSFGEAAKIYDDPQGWWGRLSLDEIVRLRSGLLASTLRVDARNPWVLYEKEISLATVSTRPVSSEALLEKPPKPSLRFDGVLKPVGLSAPARLVRVEENPKPPRRLEKAVWDDARAAEIIGELYFSGVDYYTIIRAMSAGLLGRLRARRLVPTRWAITAVDSIVGETLRKSVRENPLINEVELYRGEYLGNRFAVVLVPAAYGMEWVEVWHPSTLWTSGAREPVVIINREDWRGRWNYMDGGYIAARLAVLEHLYRRRRQAYAVIIREILPDYYAPVGNWHIRETIRRALQGRPEKYAGLQEALDRATRLFKADLRGILRSLKIVRQKTLEKWMQP